MNFEVVLQEAEEGGYIVNCPALPGCHSQGDNMEEAIKNIKRQLQAVWNPWTLREQSDRGIKFIL